MMKERLELAHQLLSENGIIFISIDDAEKDYLKVLMDQIWGEQNFIANFIWEKNYSPKNNSKFVSINHEYVLCYVKNRGQQDKFNRLIRTQKNNKLYQHDDGDGRGPYQRIRLTKEGQKGYDIKWNGVIYAEPSPNGWAYSQDKMNQLIKDKKIYFPTNPRKIPRLKYYLRDLGGVVSKTILPYNLVGHNDANQKELDQIMNERLFKYPKGTKLIKYLINLVPNNEAGIVLDFFAGTGTTAHAVLDLNRQDGGKRQFILCTNNEAGIGDLCYDRIHRIMIGKTVTGDTNFSWLKKHQPYGGQMNFYNLKTKNCGLNPLNQERKNFNFNQEWKDNLIKTFTKINPNFVNPDPNEWINFLIRLTINSCADNKEV